MCTNQRKSGESISNCILIEQELEMTDKHVKIVDMQISSDMSFQIFGINT